MGNNQSVHSSGGVQPGYGAAVVPYQQNQQASVQYGSAGTSMGMGGFSHGHVDYSSGPSNPGGPMGSNPNMVWDEARQGYWIKETVVDQSGGYSGDSGGYTVVGGQPGKVIRKKVCCDEPNPPNIIVHNHKKVIYEDSSDDEITIVTPPPVVVCPPQPPIILLQTCCPEKPKPSGPSTFFPEVRERPYLMETQVKQSSCMPGACGGGFISCGPCGGTAGPACSRCRSYH